jgi:hypothetical protein
MVGDGQVRRNGPWRGGPDGAVHFVSSELRIDQRGVGGEGEADPDGGAGVVLVFDLSLGEGGALADAPVDGLESIMVRLENLCVTGGLSAEFE